MSRPTVSVIIPVFNREAYVGESIRSIAGQTFADFELIVVNDGSTDATRRIIESIEDSRLRLVEHDRNRGIPAARNTGLDQARGHYIAWLDSDDLARPTRLEQQVRFLAAHPQVAMVGTCAGKVGAAGQRRKGVRVPPLAPADIGAWLLFRSPFQQSSIMVRTDVLREFRYREEYAVCEDLDLFMRMARSHPLQNMPQVLIDRRVHKDQSIRMHASAVADHSVDLVARPLRELGIEFSGEDLRRHILLGKPWAGSGRPDADYVNWAEDWMRRLREVNERTRYVDGQALALATGFFWLLTCMAAAPRIGHLQAAGRFARSRLWPGLVSCHGRAWAADALLLSRFAS